MNISSSQPAVQQRPINADKDWKAIVIDHDADDVKKAPAPVEQKLQMEKSVKPNLGQKLNAFA